uniref:Uncharacterized protein n=1 Tax=Glossina pallidipes TaxID=7398 RepID=A0A1A9ZUE0_GLOPL
MLRELTANCPQFELIDDKSNVDTATTLNAPYNAEAYAVDSSLFWTIFSISASYYITTFHYIIQKELENMMNKNTLLGCYIMFEFHSIQIIQSVNVLRMYLKTVQTSLVKRRHMMHADSLKMA